MRTLRTALAAAVALTFGLAASAPASAHMHFGGGHFGGGHWGHWGGVGVFDVGGADPCIQLRPIYKDGVYVGSRPVNVCN